MKNDELLPCPFCGGVPKIYEDTVDAVGGIAANGGFYITTCSTKCRSSFNGYFNTEQDAIKAWNTRHTDPDTIVIKRGELEGMRKQLTAHYPKDFRNHLEGYNQAIDDILKGRTK